MYQITPGFPLKKLVLFTEPCSKYPLQDYGWWNF